MSHPTVLISGLGLMGGSLAGALSAAGWPVLLHHRRPGPAAAAAARGWGRALDHLEDGVSADLAVVCTPVSVIGPTVRALAAATKAVITDVGSTKARLCSELVDLNDRFVGSHPMAGSHRTGLDAADPLLYRNRVVITTPTASTPPAALALIEQMWLAAGARLLRLTPIDHDRTVAEASHLPHILACVTAAGLSTAAAPVAAGGFRDTTRVAASAPSLWADILLDNRDAVGRCLAEVDDRIDQLRRALAAGDAAAVTAWLAEGSAGRQRYEAVQPAP